MEDQIEELKRKHAKEKKLLKQKVAALEGELEAMKQQKPNGWFQR